MGHEIFDPPHLLEHFPVPNFHWGLKAGETIYLAGQGGISKSGQVPDSLVEQSELALESIEETLQALGAGNADIVSMNLFFATSEGMNLADALTAFVGVKDRMWPNCAPVGLAVPVSELFYPGLLVEVQVIATKTDI
jgi:enamine deaminase RidA (YjgF/YER057c/UK114 family)